MVELAHIVPRVLAVGVQTQQVAVEVAVDAPGAGEVVVDLHIEEPGAEDGDGRGQPAQGLGLAQ